MLKYITRDFCFWLLAICFLPPLIAVGGSKKQVAKSIYNFKPVSTTDAHSSLKHSSLKETRQKSHY